MMRMSHLYKYQHFACITVGTGIYRSIRNCEQFNRINIYKPRIYWQLGRQFHLRHILQKWLSSIIKLRNIKIMPGGLKKVPDIGYLKRIWYPFNYSLFVRYISYGLIHGRRNRGGRGGNCPPNILPTKKI